MIDLTVLGRRTDPNRTILLFGAGSSIPSGAPSSAKLATKLADKFRIKLAKPLPLCDLATVIEAKYDRRSLIEAVSEFIKPLRPVRGILNLLEFEWAGIYTTNYDQIIERPYELAKNVCMLFHQISIILIAWRRIANSYISCMGAYNTMYALDMHIASLCRLLTTMLQMSFEKFSTPSSRNSSPTTLS